MDASVSLLRNTSSGRQRLLALAALGLLLVALVRFLLPGDSADAGVRRTLTEVLNDVAVRGNETPGRRDQRVQAALERYFADPVTLRYVDMPKTGAGRPALLLWARLLGKFKTAELTLAHLEVTERGDRALAKLDVRLNAEGAPGKGALGSTSDQRTAEVGLTRRGDTWIVESVDVVAGTADQPEARP